jgi:hypothetical protein
MLRSPARPLHAQAMAHTCVCSTLHPSRFHAPRVSSMACMMIVHGSTSSYHERALASVARTLQFVASPSALPSTRTWIIICSADTPCARAASCVSATKNAAGENSPGSHTLLGSPVDAQRRTKSIRHRRSLSHVARGARMGWATASQASGTCSEECPGAEAQSKHDRAPAGLQSACHATSARRCI